MASRRQASQPIWECQVLQEAEKPGYLPQTPLFTVETTQITGFFSVSFMAFCPPAEYYTHCRPSFKSSIQSAVLAVPERKFRCSVLGLRTLGRGDYGDSYPQRRLDGLSRIRSTHKYSFIYVSVLLCVCVRTNATVGVCVLSRTCASVGQRTT